MCALWEMKTEGDLLGTVRSFLAHLWGAAGLDGIVLPVYTQDKPFAAPRLITQKEDLLKADPFVPIMPFNTAGYAADLSHRHPWMHYGVVLRPCEARALKELSQRDSLRLDGWLTIGVDCLASYPQEDLEWRLGKSGSLEALTHECLRFARQGGIALYRYRQACQMCSPQAPTYADVTLGVLGLPAGEVMFVGVQDEDLARNLDLGTLTHQRASSHLQHQREHTLQAIKERRDRTYDRVLSELPEDLPTRMGELIAWLNACQPCTRCLEVCPVYNGVLDTNGKNGSVAAEELVAWLAACASCGMCEQACPAERPLAAVHSRMKRDLVGKLAALNLG